ncbi:HEAT repeat domain-containing protein [Chloroflexi bacterium TSY]|nr:HEAT repeat domain-containing protein [Chloroflexi bacterium TSY]
MENTKQLLQALQDEDESIRFNAAFKLAKEKNQSAIPVLVEALGHESYPIRFRWARKAFKSLGEAGIPALVDALTMDGRTQVTAAFILHRLDPTRVDEIVPALVKGLATDDEDLQRSAVNTLGEIGKPAQAAIPALMQLLKTGCGGGRSRAAEALAVIGEQEAEIIPALAAMMQEDASPDAQDQPAQSAASALRAIGDGANLAVPVLIRVWQDDQRLTRVRVEAAHALTAIGDPTEEVIPALLAGLHDADWWIRLYAARLLGKMCDLTPVTMPEWMQDDWFYRAYSANSLGRLEKPPQHVVTALIKALSDESHHVRRAGAYALAKIGPAAADAIPALLAAMKSEDVGGVAAEALVQIGPAAHEGLIQATKETDSLLRRHAVYALSKIDTAEAKAIVEAVTAELGTQPFPSYADFYHPAPTLSLDEDKRKAFDDLFQSTVERSDNRIVDYRLPYPKYEFLTYLIEHKNLIVHGSNRRDLDILRPLRVSVESDESKDFNGVFAAPDAILPTYFAICDRKRICGMNNGYFTGTARDGQEQKFYMLTIAEDSPRDNPWTEGTVYILPRDTFQRERTSNWVSQVPVVPLAKLPVNREDVPFDIWRYASQRSKWDMEDDSDTHFLDAVEIYPIRPPTFGGESVRNVA